MRRSSARSSPLVSRRNIRFGCCDDVDAAVAQLEAGGNVQPVGEDRQLVGASVGVGVLEDHQLVVRRRPRQVVRIGRRGQHPQPAARVEGHRQRVGQLGKLLLRREQVDRVAVGATCSRSSATRGSLDASRACRRDSAPAAPARWTTRGTAASSASERQRRRRPTGELERRRARARQRLPAARGAFACRASPSSACPAAPAARFQICLIEIAHHLVELLHLGREVHRPERLDAAADDVLGVQRPPAVEELLVLLAHQLAQRFERLRACAVVASGIVSTPKPEPRHEQRARPRGRRPRSRGCR